MEDYEVTEAMIQFGGSFVSALGRLYLKADDENRRILKTAFAHYFAEYAELLVQRQQGGVNGR